MKITKSALGLILGLIVFPASAQVRLSGPPLRHPGTCDASAAIGVSASEAFGTFVLANDEDNELRIYSVALDASPPRLATVQPRIVGGALNSHLGITSNREADLEGSARIGDRVYWIGSHGRNSNGRIREERRQFFATELRRDGDGVVTVVPIGTHRDLAPALRAVSPGLAAAIGDGPSAPDLAPEKDGINIEGLAAGSDGRSLLIGMRNPLVGGQAILVLLENAAEVVEMGTAPRIGAPFTLDLGGRGIRSIEYVPARGNYLIIAGPNGDGGAEFDLYRWSGHRGDRPVPVRGVAELLRGLDRFRPEAMLVDAGGVRVLLISDDGDLLLRGGNTPCKNLDLSEREFRSVLLLLE